LENDPRNDSQTPNERIAVRNRMGRIRAQERLPARSAKISFVGAIGFAGKFQIGMTNPPPPMNPCRFLPSLVLLAFTTGCAVLPERVISGVQITPAAAEFIRTGVTTRAELLREMRQGHLGSPLWTWERERTIAYTWQSTNGAQSGGVVFFGRQVAEPWWTQQTDWAFCVAFDASDRVARHAFLREASPEKLKESVQAWALSSGR
jgi:hypothetical protein